MKRLLLTILLFNLIHLLQAQDSDTVAQGDLCIYRAINQNENSELFWEISAGEILENYGDSVQIFWKVPAGVYKISVFEMSYLGCRGNTTELNVFVSEKKYRADIIVPNVFTPNNDGINDSFKIDFSISPDIFEIRIYSRNGNLVFQTDNPNTEWYGEHNSRLCQSGTYFYWLKFGNGSGVVEQSGFVQLFR